MCSTYIFKSNRWHLKQLFIYITKRIRGLEFRLRKYLTVKYLIIVIIIIIIIIIITEKINIRSTYETSSHNQNEQVQCVYHCCLCLIFDQNTMAQEQKYLQYKYYFINNININKLKIELIKIKIKTSCSNHVTRWYFSTPFLFPIPESRHEKKPNPVSRKTCYGPSGLRRIAEYLPTRGVVIKRFHPFCTSKNCFKLAFDHILLSLESYCNPKAACKCTGFLHCTSSQYVGLNKLSAFEHPVERCWVLLSQIWNWSNFSLNTAQHFLCFAVIHARLNKVECICTVTLNMLSPRTRSVQRIQKLPWFIRVISL